MARTGRFGRLAPGLVLAIGLAGPLAAPAHADAVDDTFLRALSAKGIKFEAPAKALIAGHEVCDELDNGKSVAQVVSAVQGNTNLDGYHAGYFVGAAIRAYCPEHAS
jgi:Protein of unknown function (DUF732)